VLGIDGRASLASAGGFIRRAAGACDGREAADGFAPRSAASFAEIGAGELLEPVYRREGDRKIASTTLSPRRITRSFIPHCLPHEFL
jgi:hypothetical protein